MSRSFVREKRIEAGPYKCVSIYSRTVQQELRCKEPRSRKKPLSRPSQVSWNNRKSRKYAGWLIYENFTKGDYYLTFTHTNDTLPEKPEDALKHQTNTLKKMSRLYKKSGYDFKYIWFTEYQFDDDSGFIKRIHHHAIVNAGPSRDLVEECWSTGRGKKKVSLGRTQAKLIQPGVNGLQELIDYLTNQKKWENKQWKKSKKRWSRSRNLKKPTLSTNDHKWSFKKLEQLGLSNDAGEAMLLERFPNHRLLEPPRVEYNEESGWYVEVELIKWEPRPG